MKRISNFLIFFWLFEPLNGFPDDNTCGGVESGGNVFKLRRKKKRKKRDRKEYVAFIILLILGDFSLDALHERFTNISYLISALDRIMTNPEFYKEELNTLKELSIIMVNGWQFNAWMLAIVGFLLGIMLMCWINKIGKWESLPTIP